MKTTQRRVVSPVDDESQTGRLTPVKHDDDKDAERAEAERAAMKRSEMSRGDEMDRAELEREERAISSSDIESETPVSQSDSSAARPFTGAFADTRPDGVRPATPLPDRSGDLSPRAEGSRPDIARPDGVRTDMSRPETPFLAEQTSSQAGERWQRILAEFVDDPRQAVGDAHQLVSELVQRIVDGFTQERDQLERKWSSGKDVSTEDLRQCLQSYRAFFARLLPSAEPPSRKGP